MDHYGINQFPSCHRCRILQILHIITAVSKHRCHIQQSWDLIITVSSINDDSVVVDRKHVYYNRKMLCTLVSNTVGVTDCTFS